MFRFKFSIQNNLKSIERNTRLTIDCLSLLVSSNIAPGSRFNLSVRSQIVRGASTFSIKTSTRFTNSYTSNSSLDSPEILKLPRPLSEVVQPLAGIVLAVAVPQAWNLLAREIFYSSFSSHGRISKFLRPILAPLCYPLRCEWNFTVKLRRTTRS